MYRELDVETWNRNFLYRHFKDYDDPFFNITANIDVTELYGYCRKHALPFSLATLYYTQLTANEIKEFRLRFLHDKVVEFDIIHATQTIPQDDESFSFCYFEMKPGLHEFVENGKLAIEKYKALKTTDVETDRVDLIYYSVIPWISFTSFKHARRFDKNQSVPRIVFGKIFDQGGQKMMPLSVEVNHALVDGLHVGKYFSQLQKMILSPIEP